MIKIHIADRQVRTEDLEAPISHVLGNLKAFKTVFVLLSLISIIIRNYKTYSENHFLLVVFPVNLLYLNQII